MTSLNEESEQSTGPAQSSSSLERMISVLDVIEESPTGLTFDQIKGTLQLTRATLYRYVKILSEAGLITSLPDLGYTLGPRVAELDYKMRQQDPLITTAKPVMVELAKTEHGVVLLCRRYRDKVLCVHQEGSSDTFKSAYERGRDWPLLRGATSRIIMAHLPGRILARLYEQRPREFEQSGLGSTLDEVKAVLVKARNRGWSSSTSEVTKGVTGIAAAVLDNQNAVVGSLSISMAGTSISEDEIIRIAERVKFCSRIVSNGISRIRK
jgi:DNA-binding IclR family transcriptional regulator